MTQCSCMDSSNKEFENREYFKNYFIETWSKGNLPHVYYKFIKELNKTDVSLKNMKVVRYIEETYKEILDNSIEADDKINEKENIIDKKNYFYNISLGDVMFLLNIIKEKSFKIEDQLLVFAIKTMYTFFLEESILKWKNEIKKLYNNNDSIEIVYPEYLILVGGSFFNPIEYEKIIPSENNKFSRVYRKIDYSEDERIQEYFDLLKDIKNDKNTSSIFELEFMYFTLTGSVSANYRNTEKTTDKIHRGDKKNLYYNALSIFFRIIEVTYFLLEKKFNKEDKIPLIFINTENTLINYIYQQINSCYENVDKLFNLICFKNIELIEKIAIDRSLNKNSSKVEGNEFKRVFEWFSETFKDIYQNANKDIFEDFEQNIVDKFNYDNIFNENVSGYPLTYLCKKDKDKRYISDKDIKYSNKTIKLKTKSEGLLKYICDSYKIEDILSKNSDMLKYDKDNNKGELDSEVKEITTFKEDIYENLLEKNLEKYNIRNKKDIPLTIFQRIDFKLLFDGLTEKLKDYSSK